MRGPHQRPSAHKTLFVCELNRRKGEGGVRDTAILQLPSDTKPPFFSFFFSQKLLWRNRKGRSQTVELAASPPSLPAGKRKTPPPRFGRYILKKGKRKIEGILPTYDVKRVTPEEEGEGEAEGGATERRASMCYGVLQPFTTRNKNIKCQPLMEHVGEKEGLEKESPVCLVLLL